MDTDPIIATILSALLSSDLINTVFRQVFPPGSTQTIPIDAVNIQEGAFEATLCPGGCGARITIRNLDVSVPQTDRFPIVARVVLDVSVASVVNGRRAPLPLVTTGGDLTVDVNTARGRTDLKFKTQIVFGASQTPRAHFRINPATLPAALRFTNIPVDIAEIVPVPGFELEADDLDFVGTTIGGRAAVAVVNAYEEEFVPYMRQMVRYLLNTLLCGRFGTRCPERPIPQLPNVSLGMSPIVIALGVGALIVGGAYLLKRRGSGLSGVREDESLCEDKERRKKLFQDHLWSGGEGDSWDERRALLRESYEESEEACWRLLDRETRRKI